MSGPFPGVPVARTIVVGGSYTRGPLDYNHGSPMHG